MPVFLYAVPIYDDAEMKQDIPVGLNGALYHFARETVRSSQKKVSMRIMMNSEGVLMPVMKTWEAEKFLKTKMS